MFILNELNSQQAWDGKFRISFQGSGPYKIMINNWTVYKFAHAIHSYVKK